MTDTVSALRQQIHQLDALLKAGGINADIHGTAKTALERRLLDAVLTEQPGVPSPSTPPSNSPSAAPTTVNAASAATASSLAAAPRPGLALVMGLSVAVLALAGAGYAYKGSPRLPSAGPPGAMSQASPSGGMGAAGTDSPADAAANEARFAAVVEQLAQKLKDKPDNAEGWAMLARSYARLGKPEQALPAFAKAVALKGDDAGLLADYADLMAFQNNRNLAGEPTQIIDRALKVDANHPKTLALAGSAAFDRKDFAAAVKHWEHLARVSPPGGDFLAQLQSGIDEARKLGGLPPAAPVVSAAPAAPFAPFASATPAPATAGAAGIAQAPGGASPAAASNRITGTVRLSPALAAMAAPDDTVFVLARPAAGSRMPLAVQRYKVKDLPVQFSLDDSMAMAPQARLSLHEQVVVAARVSKSGQAVPAPGDIGGQSQPVSNNARDLTIEMTEVVK